MSRKKRSVHRYTPYTPIYSTSNDLPNVSSWVEWKQFYQRELANDKYGYETKFIDLVLSQVDIIVPSDVRYQYHFKQANGKNRFIDFLILNQEKGYCLAIELDGYGKMLGNSTGDSKDYDKFNDFMVRQNALLTQLTKSFDSKQFKVMILRYTNKYYINNVLAVIKEITDTLNIQVDYFGEYKHSQNSLTGYEQSLQSLELELKQKESYIQELSEQVKTQQENQFTSVESNADKDEQLQKLKSENAKLKWIEMKYKELTEQSTQEKENVIQPVVAVVSTPVTDTKEITYNDLNNYEVVFTPQEQQALDEIFKNNSNEIDWEATRKALSKQPERLKKVEINNSDTDHNNTLFIVIVVLIFSAVLFGLFTQNTSTSSLNQEQKPTEVNTHVGTNKGNSSIIEQEPVVVEPTSEVVERQSNIPIENTVENKTKQSTEYSLVVEKTKQQYEEIRQKYNQNETNRVAQTEEQLELEKQKLDNQTKDIDNLIKEKEYQIDLLERYLVKGELASNDTVQSNQQDDITNTSNAKEVEIPMDIPTE